MARLRSLALLVSSVAIAAAACSSGGSASGAPGNSGGGGGGQAGAMPCDKIAPSVTEVTGLTVAATDAQPDDCTFTVNQPGDSSSAGLGGVISIRMESDTPADFDTVNTLLTGTDGVDLSGVGDRARRTKDGSLMYAVHNGHVWGVQQELIFVQNEDLPGNASKLMLALFQVV